MSLASIILAAGHAAAIGRTRSVPPQHRRLLARGAIEIGASHYPLVVSVHAAWLIALWIWGRDQDVNLAALAGFVVLQGLRLWILATLGPRWTTRIIVLPGEPLVASGPYRYLAHPNYAVVAGEIALLPLALHLPAAGADLHRAERRGARDPDSCRSPRAFRGRRPACTHRSMSDRQEPPSGVADVAPSIGTWAGFLLMCLGMFMAILDIQVVATSLPTIQQALAISPDAMSWIQTAYLIAEVIAIPLTGLFTRVLTLRWLFAVAVALFTLASIGCAFSGGFADAACIPRGAGIFRRRADPCGLLRGIPAVSARGFTPSPPRSAGVVAVLAPTVGPVVGGWITETWSWPWLFLINVIPGLIAASVTPLLLPRQDTDFGELAKLDGRFSRAAGRGAGRPRDRVEGSAASWLAVAHLHGLAGGKRGRPRLVRPSHAARRRIRWCGLRHCGGVRLRSAAP